MKMRTKLFIASGIAVFIGAALLALSLAMAYDARMDNILSETLTFSNISEILISADMSDIEIIGGDTNEITLTYFTDKINQYDIQTADGVLSVKSLPGIYTRAKWYDYINLDLWQKHEIILTVPRSLAAEINLDSDFGDIKIEGIECQNLSIENDFGDIKANDIECQSLSIENDCGDIKISDCTLGSLVCNCDYGDIRITQSTADNLTCSDNCGDIKLDGFSGKNIKLDTSLGDIKATISGKREDYKINAQTDLGDKNILNKTDGKNTLDLKTELGDINVTFEK